MIYGRNSLMVLLFLVIASVSCSPNSSQERTSVDRVAANSPPIPQSQWKTLQGQGLTLSLPPNYEGGNPNTQLETLENKLKSVNPKYVDRLQVLKRNPNSFAFVAFDATPSPSGMLTNVGILTQKNKDQVETFLAKTVEELVGVAQQQGRIYTIKMQKIIAVGPYQAGQIIGEVQQDNISIKQLIYTIKAKDTFWIVTYATTAEQFSQRLPEFESSIQSLKLKS